MSFDQIEASLNNIKKNVRRACVESGRDSSKVKVLAVSKGQTVGAIREAYRLGHKDFGENYLQEAKEKFDHVSMANWHFIGGIQSNKTKEIAKNFDWVHSVDSEKLAKRLSEHRDPKKGKLKIFLQVNTVTSSCKIKLTSMSEENLHRLLVQLLDVDKTKLFWMR